MERWVATNTSSPFFCTVCPIPSGAISSIAIAIVDMKVVFIFTIYKRIRKQLLHGIVRDRGRCSRLALPRRAMLPANHANKREWERWIERYAARLVRIVATPQKEIARRSARSTRFCAPLKIAQRFSAGNLQTQ